MKAVDRAIGDPQEKLPNIRERARLTGLDYLYVVSYRSASHLSHASIYAIDALSELSEAGVRVTADPPPHRNPRGIYIRGALLLREALRHAAKQWRQLRVKELDAIGSQLAKIQARQLDKTVPGWREDFGLGKS